MEVLAYPETLATAAQNWLDRFERALAAPGTTPALASLFVADGYWRDLLALTWRIQTTAGFAHDRARSSGATRVARNRSVSRSIPTAPRRVA